MDFGNPRLLLLLVEVVAMAYVAFQLARWRRRAQERFAGGQTARWQRGHAWPRTALLLGAATLLVLAAARPQWGDRELQRERLGVEVVIVLDVSQSMLAQDVQPNRLGLAQAELERLVETLRGHRIGLVYFAGSALLRSPLTTDTQAVSQLIQRAGREGGLVRGGSDIGAALDQAARILGSGVSDGKAVIVVSDGEDHRGAFEAGVTALRDNGTAVFAVGAGTTDGGTIPQTDQLGRVTTKLDPAGAPIVTRLDEGALQSIARLGGGRYVRLGEQPLTSLADDLLSLEQTPLGSRVERIPTERFQLFAGAAFALLILGWLVPERILAAFPGRLPRHLRPHPGLALLLVALVVGACGPSEDPLRKENERANQLYREGTYQEALAVYEGLLAQRPDLPQLSYNAGNALNRLGNYERAVAETQRALPPEDNELGAATYYALGNHLFALDELEQAYLAYRGALLLDPTDQDAKFNLELTLLRILQRDTPQQPPQGEGEPGEGEPGEEQGQPQGGEPGQQPGEQPGQQQPGESGGGPGQPQQPGQESGGQPTAEQLRRSLEEALQGIDEDIDFEDAIQILDLLRQQQERRLPSINGAPAGPDY